MSGSPKNTPLTWLLTAAVLFVGGERALDAWQDKHPPAPEPARAPAGLSPAEHPNVQLDAAPRDPTWIVTATAHLSDLRAPRWTEVREGPQWDVEATRAFNGTLVLGFGDDFTLRWPVEDGEVAAKLDPATLLRLSQSQRLTVTFGDYPPQVVDFSWLRPVASPAFVEREAEPTRAHGVVRNPSIEPLTVRVRGGWKRDGQWLEDAGHAARAELEIPPGGTVEFELDYSPATAGAELAKPVVRALR